ncbi:elongation factor P 5-aminopentanone reductase [Vagococcus lutrae]|uniref:elongation factor P 5-aminopentanone reductase n=1 Tax=Vagococcus lutrae TaxID=81947 RepID=UPI000F864CAC|nr:SDR family NAD(P)-dependent oxidoreductase [Vagococcus lutrae]RST91492.1 3-oxoacyl-ACP reductase [Vagococcus lutrae]
MKYALILGASGDIGMATARELASAGWSLYCHYHRHEEVVKTLVQELCENYPEQLFSAVSLDMTQSTVPLAFYEEIGPVDAVIFANGKTVYKLLTEMEAEEMDELWRLFVKTPALICQHLQENLAKRKQGRIVFISSVYGFSGSAMEVMYSTLKGAQHAFVKAYAQEVASLGMTVNAVAPGAVDTHMNTDWTAEEQAQLLSDIPLQRMASPYEVATLVTFLLGESASYITGASIPITGGWKY